MSLTAEQKAYLAEIAPGRFWMEIDALFTERFGFQLGKSKIRYTLSQMGIKSNVSGRERGCETPMSEKYQIGDEMTYRGNVWVKVSKGGSTNKPRSIYKSGLWEKKQNLVWEKANGKPLPEGYVIMFADGNRNNFDSENLVAVPLDVSQWLYGKRIKTYDRESFESAVAIARINLTVKSKLRGVGLNV